MKYEFREAMLQGKFGNHLRHWKTFDDIIADGYTGEVTIRRMVPNSNLTLYRVPVSCIKMEVQRLGLRMSGVLFNESAPDNFLTMQGELWGHSLMYSHMQAPMKVALTEPLYAEGLKTEILLRTFMDPTSLDALNELRVDYVDSVIEFSCYDRCLGNIPHRNTIIWEIRDY